MHLRFFYRRPSKEFFSIEELFQQIESEIGKSQSVDHVTLPQFSTSISNIIRNASFARKHRKHINHITGDAHYIALLMPAGRTVLTVHDCGALRNAKGIRKWIIWLLWFYLPLKKLKYVTAISEQTKQELLDSVNINPSRITVINNCLIGEYHKKLTSFNSVKPRILQIGFTPNKNLERIASALKGISHTLVMLGRPTTEIEQLLIANGIDYEVYAGLSRNAVAELYASSDCLLFPSTLEGFGLPIIEAQASGIPVITSNISPMREVAGEGACLVDPLDTNSIRNGLLKVIGNGTYRELIVEKGLLNVQRFTPAEIARQYIELYKKMN